MVAVPSSNLRSRSNDDSESEVQSEDVVNAPICFGWSVAYKRKLGLEEVDHKSLKKTLGRSEAHVVELKCFEN